MVAVQVEIHLALRPQEAGDASAIAVEPSNRFFHRCLLGAATRPSDPEHHTAGNEHDQRDRQRNDPARPTPPLRHSLDL
jgi:hypothetical protein